MFIGFVYGILLGFFIFLIVVSSISISKKIRKLKVNKKDIDPMKSFEEKFDLDLESKYYESLRHKKLPIYCFSDRFLEYDEWSDKFEDEIDIELAEIGANREMDFDSEREFEKRYDMYLIHMKSQNPHN